MAKQDKYTRSARGKPCQVRIPGVCKAAPENETTIPAHINGAGMALRHSNIHLAYCCDACHEWLDGGWVKTDTDRATRDLHHLEAVIRTQIIMIEDGVLVL